MKARRGRHNDHTVYIQVGAHPVASNGNDGEPGEGDIFLCTALKPGYADLIVNAVNHWYASDQVPVMPGE